MNHPNLRHSMAVLAIVCSVIACKKEINTTASLQPTSTDTVVNSVSTEILVKDSIYTYTKDVYLWEDQIPSSFNVQSLSGPETIMEAIRAYSNEPGFSGPVDRWSFAMKKDEWDNMSAGLNLLQGNTSNQGDFGMQVFFRTEGDLRVRLVEPASPAGKAGVHRGWRITKINSSTNISTSNADFIVSNIYESTSSTITFLKPDGSSQTIQLSAGHYTEKPVYLDTVYAVAGKKIGYLVFNSFLGNENQVAAEFQRVFSKFSSQGVGSVVVDLRYNGGGYVSLQEKLANYLVNSSASGSVMMKQIYNSNNTANNGTTYFKKSGSLNISDVYFIVGRGTASASELLINNLKPYMNVKLFGANNTHGKPVGFFPIPVGDWYIFPVSFRTVNKNGEGNYFNGIPVNSQVADGLDKDWGDISETSLAATIRFITTGMYNIGNSSQRIETADVAAGNELLEKPFLKVTIDKKLQR